MFMSNKPYIIKNSPFNFHLLLKLRLFSDAKNSKRKCSMQMIANSFPKETDDMGVATKGSGSYAGMAC